MWQERWDIHNIHLSSGYSCCICNAFQGLYIPRMEITHIFILGRFRQLVLDRLLPVSWIVAPHLLLSHFPCPTENPQRTEHLSVNTTRTSLPSLHSHFSTGYVISFGFSLSSPFLDSACPCERNEDTYQMLSLAILHTKGWALPNSLSRTCAKKATYLSAQASPHLPAFSLSVSSL